MQYHLTAPSRLQATVALPASKSISNRVLILHALAHSRQLPGNLSDCDDTAVMVKALLASSDRLPSSELSAGAEPTVIDIKAAGTAMRFLTAYLSLTPGTWLLTGTERMQHRPIGVLVDALRSRGANISYVGHEGFPPLCITGQDPTSTTTTLHGGRLCLPGGISSQYVSALLMIGPLLSDGLRLELTGTILSRPYIDLTLALMRLFGAEADWTSASSLEVKPGNYQARACQVEADWSAASYWYEALALAARKGPVSPSQSPGIEGYTEDPEIPYNPSVELLGLVADSCQGDHAVADLFGRLGIRTAYTDRGVSLSPMGLPVARLVDDLGRTPDLAQTVVVTCCMLGIPFRLAGLESLRIKETDRIAALITELHRLGFVVREEQSGVLSWQGERCPVDPCPVVRTYADHRMAMAFAPAALMGYDLSIDDPEVVSKSYPHFWDDLRRAGFMIEPR